MVCGLLKGTISTGLECNKTNVAVRIRQDAVEIYLNLNYRMAVLFSLKNMSIVTNSLPYASATPRHVYLFIYHVIILCS